MKVTAKLNYLHISPRKVRAVVAVVKKMNPKEAMAQLRFVPNRASQPLMKLIKSALANAENNFSIDTESARISEFKVDGGPVFKRFRPASRGRASALKKKTSHITLVLEGQRRQVGQEKKIKPDAGSVKIAPESVSETKSWEAGKVFEQRSKPKEKKSGFVKRIFQRKAI